MVRHEPERNRCKAFSLHTGVYQHTMKIFSLWGGKPRQVPDPEPPKRPRENRPAVADWPNVDRPAIAVGVDYPPGGDDPAVVVAQRVDDHVFIIASREATGRMGVAELRARRHRMAYDRALKALENHTGTRPADYLILGHQIETMLTRALDDTPTDRKP